MSDVETWAITQQEAREEEKNETEARRKRRLVEYDCHLLVINLNANHMDSGYYKYEVDLERMNTPSQFVHWLLHLREKIWFTPQMEADFLTELFDVACVDRKVIPCKAKWNWRK